MYGKTGYATKCDYDRARYIRLKAEREAAKPPHPISLLSETDKAYIAGLIDGEGAIYSANNKKTCHPTIAIGMTSENVLRWLKEKTGAQKIHIIHPKHNDRYKDPLKTQYSYRTSGKTAQMLCRAMLPYLKVKHKHAQIVCEFPIDARIAPGHKISQGDINVIRYRLGDELTTLNDNRYKRRHK